MIITYIGGGNMASALIGGLAEAGGQHEIRVADRNEDKRRHLEDAYGARGYDTAAAAVAGADVIVIAVKPQGIAGLLEELEGQVDENQCIVSVVAGVTLATFRAGLGAAIPLVRTMPNTPSLLGMGATGLYADTACDAEDRAAAEAVMGACSETVWVSEERLIDAVTAVSGSGPAYYYLFTEALAEAGEKLGLARETAEKLAVQTAGGAGAMMLQSDVSAAELRRRVTSPGGTTQAAIGVLETGGLRALVNEAASAAAERGKQLAGEGSGSDHGS